MEDLTTIKKGLAPLLKETEGIRKKYRLYKRFCWLPIQLTFICFTLFFFATIFFNSWVTQVMSKIPFEKLEVYFTNCYFGFWVLYFVILFTQKKWETKFHTNCGVIVQHIIEKIAPNFKLNRQKQLQTKTIQKSGLIIKDEPLKLLKGGSLHSFYEKWLMPQKNKSTISNLGFGVLSGKVQDTALTMASIKITSYKSLRYYLQTVPILNFLIAGYKVLSPLFLRKDVENSFYDFTGMFAEVDFNKKFKGTTLVLPDRLEKKTGFMAKNLQSLNLNKNQLVYLESIEFEKEFVVYSTDQIEARYILSPSLMERILLLKRKIDKPIMLSFNKSKLYVAIPHTFGFLQLEDDKNLQTSNALETIYNDINFAIGIVEDLNLNTKIW